MSDRMALTRRGFLWMLGTSTAGMVQRTYIDFARIGKSPGGEVWRKV